MNHRTRLYPINPDVRVWFSDLRNEQSKGSLGISVLANDRRVVVFFNTPNQFFADDPNHTFQDRLAFERKLKDVAAEYWQQRNPEERILVRRINYSMRYRKLIERARGALA